jgi:hypothetical protein
MMFLKNARLSDSRWVARGQFKLLSCKIMMLAAVSYIAHPTVNLPILLIYIIAVSFFRILSQIDIRTVLYACVIILVPSFPHTILLIFPCSFSLHFLIINNHLGDQRLAAGNLC